MGGANGGKILNKSLVLTTLYHTMPLFVSITPAGEEENRGVGGKKKFNGEREVRKKSNGEAKKFQVASFGTCQQWCQ